MYDNMKELIAVFHMEIKFVPPHPQFMLMFFYHPSLHYLTIFLTLLSLLLFYKNIEIVTEQDYSLFIQIPNTTLPEKVKSLLY